MTVKNDIFGYSGSGMGKFKRGRWVAATSRVKIGDLIVCVSRQFSTVNVARVLAGPPAGGRGDFLTAVFVNPHKPADLRQPDDRPFTIWNFDLERGDYYKAVPNRPIKSPQVFRHHVNSVLVGRLKTLSNRSSTFQTETGLRSLARRAIEAFDRGNRKVAQKWLDVLSRS